jgi:hypothetical protein
VNFLRDSAISQFSIRWFLTLNCLSQKARQVQMAVITPIGKVESVLCGEACEHPDSKSPKATKATTILWRTVKQVAMTIETSPQPKLGLGHELIVLKHGIHVRAVPILP